MTYYKKTACPYDCPSSCGLEVETDGKTILSVRGDKDHPLYHGMICRKMQHYERAINNPDRLKMPLKNIGKKGEGHFVPVSWDEAIKDITDRWKSILADDGPDAFVGISSSGNQGWIQKNCVNALFNKIGARQIEYTLCLGGREAGYDACTGGSGSICPSEMKDSDYIIVWSSNISATRIHTVDVINKARKEGKKAVLVEVCAVDDAKYFDEVLLVKPGSDGALALAMLHVIVEEGLADETWLHDQAHGYDEFKNTLPRYTPEWAEEVTGIKAETIRRIAIEYGHAKAPSILQGNGNTRRANGGMAARLITILCAITGKWGVPGAGYAGRNPNPGKAVDINRIARPDFRTFYGSKAILPIIGETLADVTNPVKALYISGSNPVVSTHDRNRIIKGMLRDELFTVVHEQFLTDTALYADYVLPATFSVEATDLFHAYGYCSFTTSLQIIDPPGECKSNWDTVALLAKGMGYDDDYFRMTDKEMLNHLLENHLEALDDISDQEWETLRTGGSIRLAYADHNQFKTPDGKFMIVNEALDEPIPCYKADFDDGYLLSLVAIPSVYTLNTVFEGRKDLLEARGPQTVWLHPTEAQARGIEDGDDVIIKNDLAEICMKAKLQENVSVGVAAVPGVYCENLSKSEASLNALHQTRLADMGHGTTMNGNYVEVIKRGFLHFC